MRAVHADAVVTGDADAHPRRRGRRRRRRARSSTSGRAADVLPAARGARRGARARRRLPGLVNAHTHLELSALRGQVPGGRGFVAWVEQLIGARAEAQPGGGRARRSTRAVAELDAFGHGRRWAR